MNLSFQITQSVMAAEMMAATAALRAQTAVLQQQGQTLKLQLPKNMAVMNQGWKVFSLQMTPEQIERMKQLGDQMRALQTNAPENDKKLQ